METRVREIVGRVFALRGRQSNTRSLRVNLTKTFCQSVVLWLFFFGVLPWFITAVERYFDWPQFRFPLPVAVTLFLAGWVLAWASAYSLVAQGQGTPLPIDSTNNLVVAGAYCFIRNPMAVGSLTQSCAVGLALGSPLVMLYTIAGGIFWNFTVRVWEEADLQAKFGDEYACYRREVRCWIPRYTRYEVKTR